MIFPVVPSLPCLAAGADIDVLALLVGVFGGLALFLYGMELMSGALKAVAGDRMRGILAQLTASRLRGMATGAFVTAAVQSSSVTTVLVVGFVSAGLMTMTQSVSVIMGANIGSTITAQIIAFNVTRAALGMIALGFAVTFVGRGSRTEALRDDPARARSGLLRHRRDERRHATAPRLRALPRRHGAGWSRPAWASSRVRPSRRWCSPRRRRRAS